MTGWYNPPHLASIAIRVAISTVFGEFSDRRDAMAASRPIDPEKFDPAFDYSAGDAKQDLWFDYAADLGDGWDATYAIARLLSVRYLQLAVDKRLPLGRFLIFGGDAVYPTASRDDYSEKLAEPFDVASANAGWVAGEKPHLFAIPGNHDWYDGLLAFLGLFCARRLPGRWNVQRKGRDVGGRETRQVRSYFALKLPQNWWLWGVDAQFEGYVDQPQIDFFTHVAKEWMPKNARLIVCTGLPSWAYVDEKAPEQAFRNFSYLERLAALTGRGHQLRVVISGDSHHYSRYVEGERQYITCGGGGAFLHPTHQLKDRRFLWMYPPPDVQGPVKAGKYERQFTIARDSSNGAESIYPPRDTSRRLAWRNLAFAFLNWQYAATLAVICAILAWLLHANAAARGQTLLAVLGPGVSLMDSLSAYLGLALLSPWPFILAALATAGYIYFARFGPGWPRVLAGILHATVQGVAVMVLSCLVARLPFGTSDAVLIVTIGVVGGLSSATLLGVYLLFCLNVLGKHWNEAFSSLRIRHYKCFLRCRIDASGRLTIFPIGLNKVPLDRSDPPHNPPLKPHAIEQEICLA
jgi:hypothetical protein